MPDLGLIEEAKKAQQELRKLLVIKPFEASGSLVAGVDVSIVGMKAGTCCIVVLDSASLEIQEVVVERERVCFPYIPGFLSFREGPLFIKAYALLRNRPGVFFFDGQGIAHPRRFGLASHMGLLINAPTVGVAKSRLIGNYLEPGVVRGSWSYLEDGAEKIGAVLRTREGVRPVFVSPGHLTDILSSVQLTMSVTGRYRIPEPTRLAHIIGKNSAY